MKLLRFLLLLAIVVASTQAASNSLTTYWNSQLQGVLIPPSIMKFFPAVGSNSVSSQFMTNNPNISEDVNILKCHATQRPPKLTSDSTSLHFLEKDLSNNSELHVFPRFPSLNSGKANFVPRTIVEGFPTLKSINLPIILAQFFISPKSAAAKVIKHTVQLCEHAAEDDNVCITSLESMIDFVQSKLGKSSSQNRIRAFSTTMEGKYFNPTSNLQPYHMVEVKKVTKNKKSVVTCHKAEFPFAVFLCHQRPATVPYMVTLEGVHDRTRIEAATVCHMDTSEWDARFPGLVALKATPGTPVCHFLNQGSVLWVVERQ
ncbi:BURP domain protein RD22 [Beta vulgaris subsp. vulgaris]|uniref:BURP domain protein RD22 n=1 Tax=Beta vulgaris subsp. vulgaris TaxID=3555 RepID=UPI002036E92C|nr:BURP domain protein RD22 [Beta vulgaris subsp. vulgaris]